MDLIEKIKEKFPVLGNLFSAITSVVCMGSVSSVAMVGMTVGQLSSVGIFLQSIGLGFLTIIPDSILRPILIFVLTITVIGSYLSYRKQRKFIPFLLTLIGSVLIYPSIYILFLESLYYFSLVLLLVAIVLNLFYVKSKR